MGRYRYNLIQRLLHWAVALAVLGMLAGGITMWLVDTGKGVYQGLVDTFGPDMTNTIYMLHKSFGVVILALMVPRILAKLAFRKPDYAVPLTGFERGASGAVHGLLYVALVAMPVAGWLATDLSDYPVEFFGSVIPGMLTKDAELGATLYEVHGALGFAILVLVAVHIGAALMHGLVKRDGVLSRMGFGA